MNLFLLVLTIISNASAQVMLKKGAICAPDLSEKFGTNILTSMLKNPYAIFGLILYGISFLLYFKLLKELELSFASPVIMASTFVLVYLFSNTLFGEAITLYKILGITLIISGIVVFFFGR